MLIYETIIDNCNKDEIGILLTSDRDFKNAFDTNAKGKYFVVHEINDVHRLIQDLNKKHTTENIMYRFHNDIYLRETVINMIKDEIQENLDASFDIEEIEFNVADDVYHINISDRYNSYLVSYDYNANEIVYCDKKEE